MAGAFRYSYFTSVKFEGRISISSNAFSDSPFLKEISGVGFDRIDNYAFSNLRSLKTVESYGDNNISAYAFYKTNKLKRFRFNYQGQFDYDIRNLDPDQRNKQ